MSNLSRPLSPAMWARALFMWGILAIGALLLGIAALWMGSFIQSNVGDELEAQQISFPAADNLSDRERAIDGMTDYAGDQLSTGDGAKVYSEYIKLHMTEAAEESGYPGATYATLGSVQRQLRADVQAAKDSGDEQALQDAETELDNVTGLRNTMLTGSTLRGNLLSAYGWGNVGQGVLVVGVGILVLAVIFAAIFFIEWRKGCLPETELPRQHEVPAGGAQPTT